MGLKIFSDKRKSLKWRGKTPLPMVKPRLSVRAGQSHQLNHGPSIPCQSCQGSVLTPGSDVAIVAVQEAISDPDIRATRCISQLALANPTLSGEEHRK